MKKEKKYNLLYFLLMLVSLTFCSIGVATPLLIQNVYVTFACFLTGIIIYALTYIFIYKPHLKSQADYRKSTNHENTNKYQLIDFILRLVYVAIEFFGLALAVYFGNKFIIFVISVIIANIILFFNVIFIYEPHLKKKWKDYDNED